MPLHPRLVASDVSISNWPGAGSAPLATAKQVAVQLHHRSAAGPGMEAIDVLGDEGKKLPHVLNLVDGQVGLVRQGILHGCVKFSAHAPVFFPGVFVGAPAVRLELVTQAFLTPGDEAIYAQHAFAVYPLATHARGARGIEVPARDLAHDLPAMRAAITPDTRVVFVANPNNPTGTWLAPAALEAFVDAVPRDVLVVLDEAYNEYLDPADRADSIGWLAQYPHLLVSRTFSKAYGLAALRIGYAVASVEIADTLNRVRQPFNVNALAQAAAIAALADDA